MVAELAQHEDTQHEDTQREDTQHEDTQHEDIQCGGTPRRAVLRGAAGLAVTGLVAGTGVLAAGCARDEGPDELEAPLAAARSDAAAATAAVAAFPDLGDRLTPLADTRRAHADALAAEIRRARPDRAPAVDTAAPPAGPPASAAAAVSALRGSLGAARDRAGTLAMTTAPYRCGLLTSVAASCAGQATVLA
ncbi:hypothetical protein PHK61_11190 [Actinomycetospora lutea]|uniref:hypothetical protein n=1 Tax=Actinomycetospora lutea TaxID=663604 RepID=UPI00236726FB|nr:hypothetical protein [Actinomycetospora lutea]MDD7938978.1 hypothetical protein [Actinomycetospora lutea]